MSRASSPRDRITAAGSRLASAWSQDVQDRPPFADLSAMKCAKSSSQAAFTRPNASYSARAEGDATEVNRSAARSSSGRLKSITAP